MHMHVHTKTNSSRCAVKYACLMSKSIWYKAITGLQQGEIVGLRSWFQLKIEVLVLSFKLDRGSIRSSQRFGLSTPYRLTFRNRTRLFHHDLFNMGDKHLVLPALNLSTLNAGILIMMQQVRLMMNMVDYSMSFLLLSTRDFFPGQVGGTTLNLSYSLRFIVGPFLHA